MTLPRILILAANPQNTDRLRLDKEVRETQAAIEEFRNRDAFEAVMRWAVRVNNLQRVLLNALHKLLLQLQSPDKRKLENAIDKLRPHVEKSSSIAGRILVQTTAASRSDGLSLGYE